ncbi:MAG: hypothetical protein M0R76_01495 [Proteobacteria bacterium]|jgi:hypothetical protein|nr:hypothetical protein [Pseudomonadota bacterium]NLN61332.1 hypothetical protein [Myxococcales bacterium]
MKKTPLAEIRARFESKEKLVKELKALFDKGDLFTERLNPDKGLAHVSNAKLLRLYDTAMEVKERFGTRKKLIDDLLQLTQRTKDEDYRARFEKWGLPRLWDEYKSIARRAAKTKPAS